MNPDANEFPDPLPKTLPGAVCVQRVRCGKPGCRCSRGHAHPAFYRFWREGGRQRKRYVKRSDLDAVRAACEARRHAALELSAGWELWRQMVSVVREASS